MDDSAAHWRSEMLLRVRYFVCCISPYVVWKIGNVFSQKTILWNIPGTAFTCSRHTWKGVPWWDVTPPQTITRCIVLHGYVDRCQCFPNGKKSTPCQRGRLECLSICGVENTINKNNTQNTKTIESPQKYDVCMPTSLFYFDGTYWNTLIGCCKR